MQIIKDIVDYLSTQEEKGSAKKRMCTRVCEINSTCIYFTCIVL